MRSIAVVTTGRSDYTIYLPLLKSISEDRDLQLQLLVGGTHLSPDFGLTVTAIEQDGFPIQERVEMLLSSDTPQGIAKSMGLGTSGFAQAYARSRPDILVALGDRFEMHSAVVAAVPFNIPVAHIHGGEITLGAMDDTLRHSITKLSHLHFVATEEYSHRVIQLGEDPWRVTVCGALSLDNLSSTILLTAPEMASRYGAIFSGPFMLVTFHPVTLEYEKAAWQTGELLTALEGCSIPVVFTAPNADTNGRIIRKKLEEFAGTHGPAHFVENLGAQGYFSAMSLATAMVGNSSSGIIEAPSFELPVVNIGSRQQGRMRTKNVIDVGYGHEEIIRGIEEATHPDFREKLRNLSTPYGDGQASNKIIERLREVPLDGNLLVKRFYDMATRGSATRGQGRSVSSGPAPGE